MKKNSILKYMAISSLILSGACEMDQLPSDAIATDEAFLTVDDAVKFANGLSSKYRACTYGIFAYTSEVQGDMFNASNDFGNNNGNPHRSDESFNPSDYSVRDIWVANYSLIVNANNFIDNVGQITAETEKEAAQLNKLKGYAHFYRAAIYHDLVRRYAKPYTAASAGSTLGVPIVLTYDLKAKPARATVEQVYAQILSDIDAASQQLAGVAGVQRSIEPTIDAVKALRARVALYMGDYAKAAQVAQELIASGTYALASTAEEMQNEWVNDAGPEDIMQLFATETERGPINDIYLRIINATGKYAPWFIPTQTAVDMYEDSDLRKAQWFKEYTCTLGGADYDLVLFNKYPGNPALISSSTPTYSHKAKTFRIGEMYLVAAEALVQSGDAATAKTVLNALQTARMATPTEATMATVKAEWAKETIGENWRTDCLKRWNDGFNGRLPQSLDAISQGPNYQNKVINASNIYFFSWPMPVKDTNVNPNLVQDPEWGI